MKGLELKQKVERTSFLLCSEYCSRQSFSDFLSTRQNLEVLQLSNLLCDSFSHTEALYSSFPQRENFVVPQPDVYS